MDDRSFAFPDDQSIVDRQPNNDARRTIGHVYSAYTHCHTAPHIIDTHESKRQLAALTSAPIILLMLLSHMYSRAAYALCTIRPVGVYTIITPLYDYIISTYRRRSRGGYSSEFITETEPSDGVYRELSSVRLYCNILLSDAGIHFYIIHSRISHLPSLNLLFFYITFSPWRSSFFFWAENGKRFIVPSRTFYPTARVRCRSSRAYFATRFADPIYWALVNWRSLLIHHARGLDLRGDSTSLSLFISHA